MDVLENRPVGTYLFRPRFVCIIFRFSSSFFFCFKKNLLFNIYSATPGFLTLSFKKENGEVYHVRITQNAEGYYYCYCQFSNFLNKKIILLIGFLNDGDPRTFPTLEALAKSKPRTLKTPILVGDL